MLMVLIRGMENPIVVVHCTLVERVIRENPIHGFNVVEATAIRAAVT